MERMIVMQENNPYPFISFCYINKSPELKLISYTDIEKRVVYDDTDEWNQAA